MTFSRLQADTAKDQEKYKELLKLDGNGRLPDFSFSRPITQKMFEVRLIKSRYLLWSSITLFLLFLLMLSILWPYLYQPLVFSKNLLEIVSFLCINLVLSTFSFREYLRYKKYPVLLVVYEDGIWLNRKKLFVPYERLYSICLESQPKIGGMPGTYENGTVFYIFLGGRRIEEIKKNAYYNRSWLQENIPASLEKMLRIPLHENNSYLNMNHLEIVAQLQIIAIKYNEAKHVSQPLFPSKIGSVTKPATPD